MFGFRTSSKTTTTHTCPTLLSIFVFKYLAHTTFERFEMNNYNSKDFKVLGTKLTFNKVKLHGLHLMNQSQQSLLIYCKMEFIHFPFNTIILNCQRSQRFRFCFLYGQQCTYRVTIFSFK